MTAMNLFEDLKQRVTLLNSQLRRVKDEPGSETRKILYTHLWRIVEELNERLDLRLENTALDLYVEEGHLVIHYFEQVHGSADNEIFLRVDPSFSVARRAKTHGIASTIADLDSQVHVAEGTIARDRFRIPGFKSSDLPVGNDWIGEEPPDPEPHE
jgi:hypothetical protein